MVFKVCVGRWRDGLGVFFSDLFQASGRCFKACVGGGATGLLVAQGPDDGLAHPVACSGASCSFLRFGLQVVKETERVFVLVPNVFGGWLRIP